LVCAGGIGEEADYVNALEIGYSACQLGTRFIATHECEVHDTYRAAIVDADEEDIVLTHRLSGVPCSVIRTPLIDQMGTEAGPIARWLLKNRKTRHWMRTLYTLKSIRSLKRSSREGLGYKDVYQAGKSVAGIDEVLPAAEVVRRFRDALTQTLA
jgi:nitronate monooxygenase